MDYIEGFNDAVEMFEVTVNNEIDKLTSKEHIENEDYVIALDRVISTLYVAKLIADRMEDEYVESLEDNYFNVNNLFKDLDDIMALKDRYTKEEF